MAYDRRKPREPQLYVNNQIKAPFIILVDETGKQLGKYPRRKMVEISEAKWLDMIQLHYDFNEKVATVRLVDLGKYLYEKQKTVKEKKKTQRKQGIKQIKFRYSIGENDLVMKKNKIRDFLQEGYSVKVTVRLRWRERIYASKVQQRLVVLQQELEDVGKPQFPTPRQEWSSFIVTLFPKRK